MVAEEEQGALGHDDLEGHRGRAVTGVQERRLVHRPAVHLDPPLPAAADHVVSPHAHDALDEVAAPEVPRSVEHDDIAAPRLGTETVRQLIYENAVPDPQSVFHGSAGNLEGLHHESVEDQQKHQADQQGQ